MGYSSLGSCGLSATFALSGSDECTDEVMEASVDGQSVLLQSHFLAFARSHCLISEVPLPLVVPVAQPKTGRDTTESGQNRTDFPSSCD